MSKKDLYNKFENFANELEKQLDLLGLVKVDHKPLEISYKTCFCTHYEPRPCSGSP